GELCLGGDGLALGYLNNPGLTAEKFIKNPYAVKQYVAPPKGPHKNAGNNVNAGPATGDISRDRPAERLYRTGDLASWGEDGNIHFLGRLDQQVKIRGFRIEPGEIMNRLLEIDGIQDAFVMDHLDNGGEKYLCAYVATAPPDTSKSNGDEVETPVPGIEDIKSYLAASMPDYMVPAHVVHMEKLPLTANGKIDRRALPVPGITDTLSDYTAPRNDVEIKLVAIWSKVLPAEKERISIDADFFQLGGHSLKATSLVAGIHKEFQVQMPLTEIFTHPTIRDMAAYISGSVAGRYTAVEPPELREYYPLSSAQKRMFVLQQQEDAGIAYNLPQVVNVKGTADKTELETAFNTLIRRHEALRTSFQMVEGRAVQRIYSPMDFKVEYFSLAPGSDAGPDTGKESHHPLPEQEIIDGFVRPFNLSEPPLLRAGVLRTGDDTYILMVDMHHIITDGTSMGVFIEEFYRLCNGEELPPLKLQYKDYACWWEREEQQAVLKEQEKYWMGQFQGDIPALDLPLDFTRPPVQSFAGNSLHFQLEEPVSSALKKTAATEGTTLYMFLLAVCNILWHKLSNQDDIIIGTPIAGRRHADLQHIIGMFVNALPMRSFPAGHKSVREFLREVKDTALKGFENQEYPFDELVGKIAVKRDVGRSPLFDVTFVVQNIVDNREQAPQTATTGVEPYGYENHVAKFDITIQCTEAGEKLELTFEYCTKLFKSETMERFARYFRTVIAAVLQNPSMPIADIDILSPNEREQLLYGFNNVETGNIVVESDFPRDKCISDLLADRIRQFPGHTAVVFNEVSTTYGDIDRKANLLAVRLKEKGVEPGTIVGLMIERSLSMVIGMLAVLKAGGAYLPIDPDSPDNRTSYMLKDSNIKLLLTKKSIPDEVESIDPDIEGESIGPDAEGELSSTGSRTILHPGSLFYIIYTSGSTGQPKAVAVRHKGFVNLVTFHQQVFGETETDRVSQVANPAFDAMAFEVWPCLCRGAALYIADEDVRMDPLKMKAWLLENKISVSFQPTVMAERLLDLDWPTEDVALRVIRTAGDTLTRRLPHEYPFRFYNLYGPTEDTVWTTWTEVGIDASDAGRPPIGKPIANHRVYILDGALKLQPPGVPGELCAGGAGVALGYLNRPGLTAEKFVQNPFIPNSTLYRTGDLAKWLPGGDLEFLGRIDSQVKIRGFRIELGEIENRLLQHSDITGAVVLDVEITQNQQEKTGEKLLCAFHVSTKEPPQSELTAHLSRLLPGYMVPAYFIPVDSIPMTANGKVDRKALLEKAELFKKKTPYTAPRNPVEEQVTAVLRKVLEVKIFGIHDNFFQAGGDSLKAVQVVAQLAGDYDISITQVFQNPTAAQLAATVTHKKDFLENKVKQMKKDLLPSNEVLARQPSREKVEDLYKNYKKKLEKDIPVRMKRRQGYKRILITGVTGFLGIHLVPELLEITDAKLFLLVRAGSTQEAEERFRKKSRFYFTADLLETHKERLHIVAGDLLHEDSGMDAGTYETLCNDIDAVVHSAANVRHFGTYEEFYRDNVTATRHLLEWASRGNPTDFHYISTLSLGNGTITNPDDVLFTEYCHDIGQTYDNFYLQSKFEAEKEISAYRKQGLNASIYRMGNLSFHSQSGIFQENIEHNAFYANLKAFISMGMVPADLSSGFELTPIDCAARATALLLTRKKLLNETFHLQNHHMVGWRDMDNFLENTGIKIQILAPELFFQFLMDKLNNEDLRSEVERFMLHAGFFEGGERNRELTSAPVSDRTRRLLETIGFQWPEITETHIERMIRHCKDVHFPE
ncbi:MAG: amino acid adenylation domain-containing protein, partial [bacterium]|nr:amino acid adenylation domain-containing protein [bacterium]